MIQFFGSEDRLFAAAMTVPVLADVDLDALVAVVAPAVQLVLAPQCSRR